MAKRYVIISNNKKPSYYTNKDFDVLCASWVETRDFRDWALSCGKSGKFPDGSVNLPVLREWLLIRGCVLVDRSEPSYSLN